MRLPAIILLCSLLLAGCSHTNPLTIAPHEVVTERPSFDRNAWNSGVVSSDSKGFIVTPHFLDRHGVKYGRFLHDAGIEDLPDGNYRITGELMSRCIEMDKQRKNKQQ